MKTNIIEISKIEIGYAAGGCYCTCHIPRQQWTRGRPNLWAGYVEDEGECKKTCLYVQNENGVLNARITCI